MSIFTSDPLALLSPQGGVIGTPLNAEGASGTGNLDVPQRAAVIGEPIPIVFCRRIDNAGGVLVSPPATEAAFSNNANNDVTASYLLVLSEGQIDSIQVRDVFQRSCRVGSFTQTYNRRAGTFVPGNTLTDITVAQVQFSFNSFSSPQPWTWYDSTKINNVWRHFIGGTEYFFGTGTYPASVYSIKQVRNTGGNTITKPEAPGYCGTGGSYTGMSTMAFTVTIPAGFDQWNRQVHCFVRGGMYVTRLLDNTLGPSNNVADLLLYLLRNSSRVPEAQIDTASLLAAATFTDVNGFWFNGVLTEATNLRDWMGDTLQYFLLRQTRVGGKEGLEPLIPTNANGTIKTTAVSWVFTFTEDHIIPGSFEISYTPLADRKPFCAMVLWRQQDDLGIGVVRTAEVRYTGTAIDGPFEQHDLSSFCATENHAVKVGSYILSKRKNVTHRLQIGVKPDAFNGTLTPGDIVRVRLERTASTGASSLHNYLYEVDRIGKSLAGDVRLELTHLPVDANLASVVALDVNAATGTGLILPTGLSGVTCDINSSADTSVPADTSVDTWVLPDLGAFDFQLSGFGESGLGDPGVDNPEDGLDNQIEAPTATIAVEPEGALPGLPLTAEASCSGATYQWYRDETSGIAGQSGNVAVLIPGATSIDYIPGINDVGSSVYSKVTCPDGSTVTSTPISVATQPQFRFNQPISATVNYTIKFVDGGTLFCNTFPTPTGGTPQISSGSISVSSVSRIQPVQIITAPGTTSPVTGYGGAAFSYTSSCLGPVTWKDGNFAILSLNSAGAVTNTAFLGGGSGYSNQTYAQTFIGALTINSIILTANAPGLGVIGDNVWRAGLGWYADVSYVDRNYGSVYVDGVLQPFNPYGPPTTP